MATSAYQTAENVKFNGTTTNAVVLKSAGGVKSLIVCDDISASDMALLDALIAANGGVTPMSGPTAGKAAVVFKTPVSTGDSTGLSNVSVATAGSATILVGGNKTGGSATGLAVGAGVPGQQTIQFTTAKAGADATGLVGATTYTATITVDGTAKSISILGSAAQTFTTLLSEINTDLGASATAVLANGNIKVTSATTGTTSTVVIDPGTLFAAPLAGFNFIGVPIPGTGFARKYSVTVVVDGVTKVVSLTGTQGNTYTNLVTELNTDLGAAATAAITGGNIVITSATTGASSSVVVFDGGLLANLSGYTGVTTVAGTSPHVYKASVVVNGTPIAISVQGSAAQLVSSLVTELNADLGANATAAVANGMLVITSATTGIASTVEIVDGDLFRSLPNFNSVRTLAAGATDMLMVLQRERSPNGSVYSNMFRVQNVVTAKPAKPSKAPDLYFDGTVWRLFSTDAVFNV